MPLSTPVYITRAARKPHGGFVLLTVEILYLLWWVYRQRSIQLRDLRVWLACQEMVARRCQLPPDQVPHYTLQELHRLVGGVGGEHLRASLRRLQAHGLLTWSSTCITFATTPATLCTIPDRTSFTALCARIPNLHRRVPVPRPTLRLLALGCRATVLATILGHLIRCLYYHTSTPHCVSGGWCKASWIAEVFQLDRRHVKAARRHLAILGWLEVCQVPQRLLNRWGSYVYVSLTWTRSTGDTRPQAGAPSLHTATVLPPPREFSTTPLPPPYLDTKPLQEHQHQEPVPHPDTPARASASLGFASTSGSIITGVDQQGEHLRKPAVLPPPSLHHIVLEDLQDTGRLLALFNQAHTQGLIGQSASDRLTFLALAEHAKVVGTRNPCGLFAALVRRQHWHFVTDSDEDAASTCLKAHLYGQSPQRSPAPSRPPPEPPALSKDGFVVHELQRECARRGWPSDLFAWVHHADPTWSRERWDRATGELVQAQAAWQHANTCNRLGDLAGIGDSLDVRAVETAEGDGMEEAPARQRARGC